MKMRFVTLGCKVNQYESQAVRELLESEGFTLCEGEEKPDVFLLNSCTVTAESDRKTRQLLRQHKRKYPNCVTVLFGCMSQNRPDEAKKLGADIVFGNTDHSALAIAVAELMKNGKTEISPQPHEKDEKYITPGVTAFSERTRSFMKIEDGCNRFCSYCAIPYARGRVRSRDLPSIKSEAEALAQNGFREIVLVGINLSAYGQGTNLNICDAVEAVASVNGIRRVRLGSLEPDHISDQMLERLAAEEKFCPQFHLSLQSGCDETLKRMNRHYDSEFYADLVERIRKFFKNPSFTTDVMVGFPGETQEEFSKSLSFVESIGFAKCHVFAYSRRSGTAADRYPDQIEKSEKHCRAALMARTAEKSQQAFLQSMVGSVEAVLFETEKDGFFEGYTENYVRVRVPSNSEQSLTNKIVEVSLVSVRDDFLEGQIAFKKKNLFEKE